MSTSSLSGTQFRQLSMVHQTRWGEEKAHSYVPVRDVAEQWHHDEGPLERKLHESHVPEFRSDPMSSLYTQIKRDGGVHTPIQAEGLWHDLDTPMDRHALVNGHHRVAALYDQNPDAQIPVIWNGSDPLNR